MTPAAGDPIAPGGGRIVGRLARRFAVRAAGAVFVLWAVATVTFFALRLIPGDPALAVLGGPGSQASAAALAHVRSEYGLDRPLLVQYLAQLGRDVTGALGSSYAQHVPAWQLVRQQFGSTLVLSLAALAVAWLVALALAAWSGRGGRVAAAVGSGLEMVGAALPHFWLGVVLILLFSTSLGWLPAISVPGPTGLVLPVLTLALPLAGFLGQLVREALLEAASSPFVVSARARGESETGILFHHTLRHAALPAIGLSGWALGSLLSGAVVVETVFARPGLGRTLLTAVQDKDVPVVTGVVLVVALVYCVMTVLAETLDGLADPRLRSAR